MPLPAPRASRHLTSVVEKLVVERSPVDYPTSSTLHKLEPDGLLTCGLRPSSTRRLRPCHERTSVLLRLTTTSAPFPRHRPKEDHHPWHAETRTSWASRS